MNYTAQKQIDILTAHKNRVPLEYHVPGLAPYPWTKVPENHSFNFQAFTYRFAPSDTDRLIGDLLLHLKNYMKRRFSPDELEALSKIPETPDDQTDFTRSWMIGAVEETVAELATLIQRGHDLNIRT